MKFRRMSGGVALAALGGMLAASGASAQTPTAPGPTPSTYQTVTFKAQSVKIQRQTAAANMTKDQQAPARAFVSPTQMAVKPGNPRIIAAATADLRDNRCYVVISKDAGHTWHLTKQPPTDPTYPYCATNAISGVPLTTLAWGRNGTLYTAHYAWGDGEGPRLGKGSIILARSTNLGQSWRTTLVDNNRNTTANPPPNDSGVTGLAVDTSGPQDVVSVGFNTSYPDATGDTPLRLPHVMVATSMDGGANFAKPVDLNTLKLPTYAVAGTTYPIYMMSSFGSPFIYAHDGVLLAVTGSAFPFNNQPNPPPEAGQGLTAGSWYAYPMPQLIARSTDHGKTWVINKLSDPVFLGTGAQTGIGWTSKGGPKGTFVLAYNSTPQTAPSMNTESIVMQRSTDGGVTWSAPLALNDDPPALAATSFYPQLNVAPNGRVDVAWYDDRATTDNLYDVHYTYSTDGGLSWAPNVKVNDIPLNFNLGISYNSDLRYPPGIASANQYAFVGWWDTRNGNDLNQSQDAYGSAVQFSPLPTTKNTTAPIIAAIFGGLVVAGIVLLFILLVRNWGEGASPRPAKATAPVKSST